MNNKIAWKCRRGMLELDLIFMRFYQEKFPNLSADEKKRFEQLLDEQDPVLASWILGANKPPVEFSHLVAQLIS